LVGEGDINPFGLKNPHSLTPKESLVSHPEDQLLDYQTLTINNMPTAFCVSEVNNLYQDPYSESQALINERLDSLKRAYLQKNRWKEEDLNDEQISQVETYLDTHRIKLEKELANTPAKKIQQMTLEIITGESKVQIEAKYYANDKAKANEILQAFKSIVYDKSMPLSELVNQQMGFQLDASKSKFKGQGEFYAILPASASANDLEMSEVDFPSYPVLRFFPATKTDMLDYVEQKLKGLTIYTMRNNLKSAQMKELKIKDYQAFEVEAILEEVRDGELVSEKQFLFYSLYITNGTKRVIIYGIAPSQQLNDFNEFKKLTHTIQLR
jgi:hypothetical protein